MYGTDRLVDIQTGTMRNAASHGMPNMTASISYLRRKTRTHSRLVTAIASFSRPLVAGDAINAANDI